MTALAPAGDDATRPGSTARRRPIVDRTLFCVCLLAAAAPLAAQSPVQTQAPPVDTAGVAPTPRLHTLLEKTIFQVDILTLDLRFGPETGARLVSLVEGRGYSDALADSVLAVSLDARDAWARMEFQRDFGFDRFQEGMTGSLRAAVKAGIVTPARYDSIASSIPEWYDFLAERGVRAGDEIFYRVRGDTLRTVYRGADGQVLLDQVVAGPNRGRGLLGGWLAPESDFREGLVKSLLGGSR